MPDKKKLTDPHAAREAKKYDNPIPSREFILETIEKHHEKLTRSQLGKLFNLTDEEGAEALRRRLRAMERDGQIIYNRDARYSLVKVEDLIEGIISAHPDGFGFVMPSDGGDDLFVGPKEMRRVFHGDRVRVRVVGQDRRGKREAAIVQIVEHNTTQVVGQLQREGDGFLVMPDHKRINHDVLISSDQLYGAEAGQMVVVEITKYPTQFWRPEGRVVQILGEHMGPGQEIDIAIRNYDIPHEWPLMLEAEIEHLSLEVPEESKKGRLDLRDKPLVTIDGEDAKDFDDAVLCEKTDSGYRLWVAIADVSSYVMPGTALDGEAKRRSTSVYFPGRVVPMLPEVLSNGLCSINPDVDRLCMVCEMDIDHDGEITDYRFHEAVMRSHARLTYNKVAAMLVDGDEALRKQYEAVLPYLEDIYSLYKVLLKRRQQRGAIDFETVETRIEFGEGRKIEQIVPVVRNDAHKLIEECMLAANVCAADFLLKNEIPTLYRCHEGPGFDKLEDLKKFLAELGLNLGGGLKPTAKDYATLLEQIKDRPDFQMIQTVMLRSLSQAVYHPDNMGHFGLAYEAYAHFTSPIRRYPDLLVHRAIKHLIKGRKVSKFAYSHEDMVALGEHTSMAERRADDATRDATTWLKCEYIQDKVGDTFSGVISGVTGFGFFVLLDDIYVEGLVHITSMLNDYYKFDNVHHRLIGEASGETFRLGDRVEVVVSGVSLDERKIDFLLAQHYEAHKKAAERKAARGGRGDDSHAAKRRKHRAKKRRGPDAKASHDESQQTAQKQGKGKSSRGRKGGKRRRR